MARRKRTSPLEDLLNVFFELTGMFWQVGAFVTVALFAGGLYSLIEAVNYQFPPTQSLTALFNQFSWLRYAIPVMLFLFSGIFGVKTYAAYQRQNYY